jgi:hypothetical protein
MADLYLPRLRSVEFQCRCFVSSEWFFRLAKRLGKLENGDTRTRSRSLLGTILLVHKMFLQKSMLSDYKI